MIGKVCRCRVVEFHSNVREIITEIAYQQPYDGSNSDIKLILIDDQFMKFLPTNFDEFFPNIEGIIIDSSQLSSITRDDLKKFRHLKFLFIGNNKIDELSADLFDENLNVEWISFMNNFIKKIGQDILSPLNDLKFANFARNSCINFIANSSEKIEKLKNDIKRYCGE